MESLYIDFVILSTNILIAKQVLFKKTLVPRGCLLLIRAETGWLTRPLFAWLYIINYEFVYENNFVYEYLKLTKKVVKVRLQARQIGPTLEEKENI